MIEKNEKPYESKIKTSLIEEKKLQMRLLKGKLKERFVREKFKMRFMKEKIQKLVF